MHTYTFKTTIAQIDFTRIALEAPEDCAVIVVQCPTTAIGPSGPTGARNQTRHGIAVLTRRADVEEAKSLGVALPDELALETLSTPIYGPHWEALWDLRVLGGDNQLDAAQAGRIPAAVNEYVTAYRAAQAARHVVTVTQY